MSAERATQRVTLPKCELSNKEYSTRCDRSALPGIAVTVLDSRSAATVLKAANAKNAKVGTSQPALCTNPGICDIPLPKIVFVKIATPPQNDISCEPKPACIQEPNPRRIDDPQAFEASSHILYERYQKFQDVLVLVLVQLSC